MLNIKKRKGKTQKAEKAFRNDTLSFQEVAYGAAHDIHFAFSFVHKLEGNCVLTLRLNEIVHASL